MESRLGNPDNLSLEEVNDLLRGYELLSGLPMSDKSRAEVRGREEEVVQKWEEASDEEREYIRRAVEQSDALVNQS